MKLAYVVFAGAALLFVTGKAAAMEKYPRTDLLIEPGDLAKSEAARQYIVLDARSEADYKKEHIPGARWVDHEKWSKAFVDGGDIEGWSQRIGLLGISPNSKVVVYDDKGVNAARIWWILRYWGVQDARLLNGDWRAWRTEGLPMTVQIPAVSQVEFKATAHAERLATKSQILDSLKDHTLQIVDARSQKEFCGIDKHDNKRGGAIPGAKNLEWSDLVD